MQYPVPDGTIDQGDRVHTAFLYRGIPPTVAVLGTPCGVWDQATRGTVWDQKDRDEIWNIKDH